MFGLRFDNGHMLWLLALAMPLVVALTFRSQAYKTKRGRWIGCAFRAVWVIVCIVALAGPSHWQEFVHSVRTCVVVVEDQSQSVSQDAGSVSQKVQDVLGRVSGKAETLHLKYAGGVWKDSQAAISTDQTDIETAIDTANLAGLDAEDCRIVLLTDGRSTKGQAVEAAARVAFRGGRVDVIPVGQARPAAAQIVQVEPPAQSRVGVPTSLRVTVHADQLTNARVVLRDEEQQRVEAIDCSLDGSETILMRFTPTKPGVQTYWVDLTDGGKSGETQPSLTALSDSQEATVYVDGPPRVLLCDNFPDEIGNLRLSLDGLGMPIDVISPAEWPKSLAPYAAVVISDWSGKELSPDQRGQLRKYVEEQGGGLVFIGGDNVLASKWRANPLSELLPAVLMEKPAQVVKKQPEASVCFVLDRSGSMTELLGTTAAGAVSKLDMVKAATLASIESLPENSHVAVVVFDEQTDVVVSPTSVELKDEIGKNVDSIESGGGTSMGPAVKKGLELLSNMPGEKYLIVLTDGLTIPPLTGNRFWDNAVADAGKNGISWTSIAVGGDADVSLMSSLAKAAGGKYYYCDAADQIPQVFIKEARAIRRVSETKRKPFRPSAGPAVAILKNVTVDEMPPLAGCVPSKAKDDADQILLTDREDPLLSERQFGLGRVACFTSDAKNAWARDWVTWQKFSTFWLQTVRGVLRPPQSFFVSVQSHSSGTDAEFLFRVQDEQGHPLDSLAGQVKAFLPGNKSMGGKEALVGQCRSTGPGEYKFSIRLPDDGRRYLVSMSLRSADGRTVNYCSHVSSSHGSEMVPSGPDMPALKAIAEAGGGVCSSNADGILGDWKDAGQRTSHQQRPLWPGLVMLAIILWPLDLAIRKVG